MTIAAWSLGIWELSERGLQIAFVLFLVVWTVALGAALGSFLNVIIYRMPRGMSLIRPKSRCPACAAPIRATDNIPILGWLRLRGRCRDCGASISVRYPLVEGLIAILVLALAWCEVYAGGINLPGGQVDHLAANPLLWRWEITPVIRCAYHAFLLIVAVGVGWMAWDGFPPPRRLIIITLLVGIIVPILMPSVWPLESEVSRWLPVMSVLPEVGIAIDANAVIIAATGLLGGCLAGIVLMVAASEQFDGLGVLFLSLLAGLYLGWPALATYAPIAGGLALVTTLLFRKRPRRTPATVTCVVALAVQVFAWAPLTRFIDTLADWLARGGTERAFVPAAVLIITLLLAGYARVAARVFSSKPYERETSRNNADK